MSGFSGSGGGGNSVNHDSSGWRQFVLFSFLLSYIYSLEQHMTSYGHYRLIWRLGKFFFLVISPPYAWLHTAKNMLLFSIYEFFLNSKRTSTIYPLNYHGRSNYPPPPQNHKTRHIKSRTIETGLLTPPPHSVRNSFSPTWHTRAADMGIPSTKNKIK